MMLLHGLSAWFWHFHNLGFMTGICTVLYECMFANHDITVLWYYGTYSRDGEITYRVVIVEDLGHVVQNQTICLLFLMCAGV